MSLNAEHQGTVVANDGRVEPPARRPSDPDTVVVMGLPFHRLDHEALVQVFLNGAQTRSGGWIVTPNLEILRQFKTDGESRELILSASHRVADGLPIIWASRLAGTPLPERVPGSDFVLTLPAAAARAGLPVFLLGGNPGVAETAAARLRARHRGIDVSFYCPPFGFEGDPMELNRIRQALLRARPALVMVGLGFPKQERVIRLLRPELPGTWFAGVGISLSFLAGDQPRAPVVLQRLGLEWMHRLCHEPRRLFRRYVVCGIPFSARLFSWALMRRLGRSKETAR
jgi:N-acetylglucosaminyldiphosphoundecaprenol N-acetyl-beta-D-mannosaminyltransferase